MVLKTELINFRELRIWKNSDYRVVPNINVRVDKRPTDFYLTPEF